MEYQNDSTVQGVCIATRKTETGAEMDLRLVEYWYKGQKRNERAHVVTVALGPKVIEVARREVRVDRVIHVSGKMRQIRWTTEDGKKQSRLVLEADTVARRDGGGVVNEHRFRGVLGRDPELRTTPGGQLVTDFSLALSEEVKGDDGSIKERTDWIDFVAWGKQAELVCKNALKGDVLLVRARIQQDTWEDRTTGEERSKLKFQADGVRVIGSGSRERVDRGPAPEREHSDDEAPAGVGAGSSADDGEPPF